jgi:hypothetical protein
MFKAPLFEAIAAFWALLLAMFIVLNWETRGFRKRDGLWSRRQG